MSNLKPYHEIPEHLQNEQKYFSVPTHIFNKLAGKTNAFMIYSFLCSRYNFLTKYSFVTVHHIQQQLGYKNEQPITDTLNFLKKQQLIEVRKVEGLGENCYQIYFIE